MRLEQIQEKAKELGMKNYKKINKTQLIQSIQTTEGNSPCYQQLQECGETDCLWREDCFKSRK